MARKRDPISKRIISAYNAAEVPLPQSLQGPPPVEEWERLSKEAPGAEVPDLALVDVRSVNHDAVKLESDLAVERAKVSALEKELGARREFDAYRTTAIRAAIRLTSLPLAQGMGIHSRRIVEIRDSLIRLVDTYFDQ